MHPHHKHTDRHARAEHLMHGEKRGGKVHSDEPEDRALFNKMFAEKKKHHELKEGGKVSGKHAHHRMDKRARGGRIKKKGGTTVNIILGKSGPRDGEMPMPMGAPMPVHPPMPPVAPAVPPMAAGAPPMPGMMPRKHGGRVKHTGEAEKRTEEMRAAMRNKKGYRSGGRVHSYPKMKYGSESGEGRLEKIEKYGRNARA